MARKNNRPITKFCNHCDTEFTTADTRKIYCNSICKESQKQVLRHNKALAKKAERLKSKEALFDKSSFATYLITEVKRGKTVEILAEHTSESFLELHQLVKCRNLWDGVKSGKRQGMFELSHIQPAAQKDHIGLLHPKNLVIATKEFNRHRGSLVPQHAAGAKITKASLNPEYFVDAKTTKAQVLILIKEFLGKAIMDEFYTHARLNLTRMDELLKKLALLGYEPSSNQTAEQLLLTYVKLRSRPVTLFSRKPKSLDWVLLQELDRFGLESSPYQAILQSFEMAATDSRNEVKTLIRNQVQHILHGDFDCEAHLTSNLSKSHGTGVLSVEESSR